MASQGRPKGPPYPPEYQGLGETPSVLPDVPVNAIFLALFIICGGLNMATLKINNARGKKFGMNGMLFGFCVTRILATTFRIVWANYPRNVQIGMVAMIFVYAGVILLFIANLFFTQRIIRCQHPHFGWLKPVGLVLPILLGIMVATVLSLIISVILEFYSLDPNVRTATRDIQCYGATFYAVVAFLPIPLVSISTIIRRLPSVRNTKPIDKFGQGSMRAKIAIVLVSSVFLTLGAAYRAGTNLLNPVPIFIDGDRRRPAPHPYYFSKAAFYCFNFTIEISVVIFWLIVRIDKRFYTPDGANGPFSYGGGFTFAGENGNEKRRLGQRDSMRHLTQSQDSGFGASRSSLARSSSHGRVSWGGISRDDVAAAFGEDGIQIVPYPGFEHENTLEMTSTAADVGVDGAEAEMGWDAKSGKWALRPISHVRQLSPTGDGESCTS
ncbi:hypothetical protein K431DRAFT_246755 [Polychaeton citri CBS 116435]|uniref:Uncharacterized protein n=1 Tax=Polychaeton citri CBS 116435 TaxID=1314669 RepID=A0A9P4UQ69_9PEZI|nr:hypothetical protein K431DRAFT_246755 [Polychaeton citri CBS 116435]